MTTFIIPEVELFSEKVKFKIEEIILRDFEEIKAEAIKKLSNKIDELMARAVVSVFEIVSFHQKEQELVITVDVSKIKERLNEETKN